MILKRGNMISKEQKSNLAKLLATENLNVEHRKVKTAYFVPKTRTLCLPIWEDMGNDLYDLLCGHEVGHALWTPADESKFNKSGIPMSYLNVIEDIRIDKKMKLKYPGLRKSYFNGYKELVARDFFGKIGEEANNMKFIDRLNIFSKSGHLENTIEFNDIEKSFIEKSNNLETFDDVVNLAKEIFAYSKEENYDKEKDPLFKQLQEQAQELKDQQEEQDDLMDVSGTDNEQPEGEEQKQSSSGEEENKEEEEKGNNGKPQGDKEDDKEQSGETNSQGLQGGYNPSVPDTINPNTEALSDKVYEEAIKNLAKTDKETRDKRYVSLPKLNYSKTIFTAKQLNDLYKSYYSQRTGQHYDHTRQLSVERFKKWKSQQSKTISYMAKEFEMKKAADNYKKTLSSKTGIINMNTIHSYKFNDDIFKRVQVEPGAKNHGMIMFIDWSGSMGNNIMDTIKQTINLAMFCKAVQIPFRVFAFSDVNYTSLAKAEDSEFYWQRGQKRDMNGSFIHKHGDLYVDNVTLIEWLSSDQKTPEYNENMLNLYRYGEYFNQPSWRGSYLDPDNYFDVVTSPSCLRLGGTPLDQTIVASMTIVKDFIAKHKIQKMNTIFLTDGCGHNMTNTVTTTDQGDLIVDDEAYKDDLVVKGPSRKSYHYQSYDFNKSTKVMYDMLRDITGTSVVGFYITSRNTANYYDIANFMPRSRNYEDIETVKKNIRKDKVGTIVGNGYDELFIIPRKNLKITDEEANINPDMTAAKMKSEFSKTLKTKKISRVLLNKFVERVA